MQLRQYLAHANDTQSVGTQLTRHGLSITIEHPKGTLRKLHNEAGKVVYTKMMYNHYGFFNGTKGRDGDEVDCIVGPVQNAKDVFVVHMKDMGPDVNQREDEDKCMIGFPSANAAKSAFLLHYPKNFFESMTVLPVDTFKEKMKTASLPYRKKKITASNMLSIMCVSLRLTVSAEAREKEGAEDSQSKGGAAHTEHILAGRKSGAGRVCPKCGSDQLTMLPPDFGTWRCQDCGKTFQINARATGLTTEVFTISTKPDVMLRFKRFLAYLQYCAGVGHSCTVGMEIDGDGPDAFYVDKPKLGKVKEKDIVEREGRYERLSAPFTD